MVSIPKRISSKMLATPSPNDLMTIEEVAIGLRVDSTTVRRWIKNGVLDALELPHKGERKVYRVRRSSYERIVPPE